MARRRGHGGGHGGAWKVAYADFVTAMMAFFLLLWLLNAVSKEQLEGISDYFSPISRKTATSGGFGLLQGQAVAKKGVFDAPREPDDSERDQPAPSDVEGSHPPTRAAAGEVEAERLREEEAVIEEKLDERLRDSQLARNVSVDVTPAGVRIQIVDRDGLAMFPRGQATLYKHARMVLSFVAEAIEGTPERIEVAGHTDAAAYPGHAAYGNWELSADRANAARRALQEEGVAEDRFSRVVGRAAQEPLFPDDPLAPGNRRLSITLLRKAG